MFTKLILKLTHRLWNRQISRILCRAQSDGLINSYQLHELAAAFDPTQKHKVYGKHEPVSFKGESSQRKYRVSPAGMVLLLMCLSLTLLSGCNGGEFAHAAAGHSPAPSQFVITKHEPCSATQTHESSSGYAPQPTDGAGQGLVESSIDQGAIESIKLIQEQANEILDLKNELVELRAQNNELTQGMGRLLGELGELKRSPQATAVPSSAKKSINILTSPTCAPCIAWKRAAESSSETQTVEKRFIDVTQGKPADVDVSEWNTVIAYWNVSGGLVPFSWWKDKSGVIRTLVGRYSDSQIEWSMNAADEQVVIPQQQNQQQYHQRPHKPYSNPIAHAFAR